MYKVALNIVSGKQKKNKKELISEASKMYVIFISFKIFQNNSFANQYPTIQITKSTLIFIHSIIFSSFILYPSNHSVIVLLSFHAGLMKHLRKDHINHFITWAKWQSKVISKVGST